MLDGWGMIYLSIDLGLCLWALAKGDLDQRFASGVLLGACALSNLSTFSWLGWGVYYPLMDLVCGLGFLMVWLRQSQKDWLLSITLLFAAMMGLHVMYWRLGLAAHWYDLGLNVLQLGQGLVLGQSLWLRGRRRSHGLV